MSQVLLLICMYCVIPLCYLSVILLLPRRSYDDGLYYPACNIELNGNGW